MDRSLVPFIRSQFPDILTDPNQDMFFVFIEEYFRWLEEEGNPGYLLNRQAEALNLDSTEQAFFEALKDIYLPQLSAAVLVDRTTLIKNVRELYRAKGTEKSIRCLFRILYNTEVEITTDFSPGYTRNVRVEEVGPSFQASINRRLVKGDYFEVVVDTGTGAYTVGETVQQVTTQGTATGEVHSWDGTTLGITGTDFDIPFEVNANPIDGQTSSASYTVSTITDKTFIGTVYTVTKYNDANPDIYDLQITEMGFEDNNDKEVRIGIVLRTVDNDADILITRTLGVIDTITINDAGENYEVDLVNPIPFATPGDGTGATLFISDIYDNNRILLPGAWSFGVNLDLLEYAPENGEKVTDYFFVGNTIEVDGTKYTVTYVDDSGTLQVNSNLAGTEDLTKVYKSFNDDTRYIEDLLISDPGYGYTVAPTLDLTGLGDGTADITLNISGSYDGSSDLTKEVAFGYTIRSTIPVSNYLRILKNTVHPAGFKFTGEFTSYTIDPGGHAMPPFGGDANAVNELVPGTTFRRFFRLIIEDITQYTTALDQFYSEEVIDNLPVSTIEELDDRDIRVKAVEIIVNTE